MAETRGAAELFSAPQADTLEARVAALELKKRYLRRTANDTLTCGSYLLDSSGGTFETLLTHEPGESINLRDASDLSIGNVTLGAAGDSFNVGGASVVSGPLTLDVHHAAIEIVSDPDTADLYHLYYLGGIIETDTPPEQLTATLPFTM